MIDLITLIEKAKFYSNELWGVEFDSIVSINNRLSRYLGWFKYEDKTIEIAGFALRNRYKELTIDSVLIHELCHWYCFFNGLPYHDDSHDFQTFVKSNGGSISKEVKLVYDIHYGKCPKCLKEYKLQGYKDGNKYRGCCGVGFIHRKEETIQDTFEPSQKLKELNEKFYLFYKKSA